MSTDCSTEISHLQCSKSALVRESVNISQEYWSEVGIQYVHDGIVVYHKAGQGTTHTFTPRGNSSHPIHQPACFWGGRRKAQNLDIIPRENVRDNRRQAEIRID